MKRGSPGCRTVRRTMSKRTSQSASATKVSIALTVLALLFSALWPAQRVAGEHLLFMR
jgi:hypothetical protein